MRNRSAKFSPERLAALQGILDVIRGKLPSDRDVGNINISRASREYYRSTHPEGRASEVWVVDPELVSARLTELNLLERVSSSPPLWWVDRTHTVEEAYRLQTSLKGRDFWLLVDGASLSDTSLGMERLHDLLRQTNELIQAVNDSVERMS